MNKFAPALDRGAPLLIDANARYRGRKLTPLRVFVVTFAATLLALWLVGTPLAQAVWSAAEPKLVEYACGSERLARLCPR
jgi:hypothetical protein